MRKFLIVIVFFLWRCVSVINYDTAEIKSKSKNQRIAGYFEGGKLEEIFTIDGAPSHHFGKFGLNYQRGYGTCENVESGSQFGGEIGRERKNNTTLYTVFDLYFLGYVKIGQKVEDHYISFKITLGDAFLNGGFYTYIFPLGYIDMMLGFPLEKEKLTIYAGIGSSGLRFGINFHFNKFSLLSQISTLTRDYFSFKLGGGYKF